MNQEKMGMFISELRKKNNLTQRELGDKLGVTDNSVSKWERGINAPDVSLLKELSEIFNVTVKELLNGEYDYKKKDNSNRNEKTLEVINVSKSFGKRKILKDVNFTLYEGEIVGLIGPNGAGKTTLIKTILGLYKMDKGSIKICQNDTKTKLEEALSKTGSIIENPDAYLNLTGKKNLEITSIINDVRDKNYVDEIVRLVGLEDRINDKVKKYSLGMKQRLGLANALIKKPKLLILDEPMNGLDPYGIKDLRNILKDLAVKENMTIFISSHILSEVENICDRILIIDEGKIISDFDIADVKHKHIKLEDEFFKKTGEKNEDN